MKTLNLRTLIFLALCCDLGLFSKRLISPAVNLVTAAVACFYLTTRTALFLRVRFVLNMAVRCWSCLWSS